jgi:hypothetical protein
MQLFKSMDYSSSLPLCGLLFSLALFWPPALRSCRDQADSLVHAFWEPRLVLHTGFPNTYLSSHRQLPPYPPATMVFEWLHMPSENGYNRRRHLSRTPPEFWSRHDKAYAGWERSKYFRALHKGI